MKKYRMSGNKIRMVYFNKRSNEYTDVKNVKNVENNKPFQLKINLINLGLILICLIYFYSLICKNSSRLGCLVVL